MMILKNENEHRFPFTNIAAVEAFSQNVKRRTLFQRKPQLQILHSSSNQLEVNDLAIQDEITKATEILTQYDQRQQQYMKTYPEGMGGGTAALTFLQREITKQDRQIMRDSILTLTREAHRQRALNARDGRIMLGICAQNVNEGLMGLKSWVPALSLPRGLLHGMDVDGKPIPPEELGSIYIKYNTGGCMTFTDMRKTGMGFDALWRPGDCVLEMYDGDFRGVYFSVELKDSIFRQFGVLPTDLFLEEDDDDW